MVSILHRRLPVWLLMLRLRRHDANWWIVPNDRAGIHASRRLGGKGWIESDLVLIAGGKAVAGRWIENGKLQSVLL